MADNGTEKTDYHGNFIYDDTPDLHRAVAWSDCYFGDYSSVVNLFEAAEKPVIIQNLNVKDYNNYAFVIDFVVDGDGIWGFDGWNDAFYRLDFENNAAEYITNSGVIPKNNIKYDLFSHRFTSIVSLENKIIAFPAHTTSIFVYDKLNKNKLIVSLDDTYLISNDFGFCVNFAITFKGLAYGFSTDSKAVVVFNCADNSVKYLTKLYDRFNSYPVYIEDCDTYGNVKAFLYKRKEFVRYNLLTEDIEILAENPIFAKCDCVDFNGQSYWLLASDGSSLYNYTHLNDAVAMYDIPACTTHLETEKSRFCGLTDCGKFVLLFSGWVDYVLKFDKELEKFEIFNSLPINNKDIIYAYYAPKRMGNKIYVSHYDNYAVYEIDTLSANIAEHRFILGKDDCETYRHDNLSLFYCKDYVGLPVSIMNELHQYFPLCSGNIAVLAKTLVNIIEHEIDCLNSKNSFKDKNVGEDIYNFIAYRSKGLKINEMDE